MSFLEYCVQWIPFWVFVVPLSIFVSLAFRLRHRAVLKNFFLMMSLLVALAAVPVCAVQAHMEAGGKEALERRFPSLADATRVRSYQLCLAGLGDTLEFWKVTGLESEACLRVAAEDNLQVQSSPRRPLNAPLWWPRSAKKFTVYEGGDKFGGSSEIWMPKEGKTAYLYRFCE